jgi:hypothetical protein
MLWQLGQLNNTIVSPPSRVAYERYKTSVTRKRGYAMGYEKSPRIRDIAERLIDDHHPHLKDAKELIEYYYNRDDSGVDWAV